MRNLRKLSYVACAVFFFTSCEETYNDKLFWPGEISQEDVYKRQRSDN